MKNIFKISKPICMAIILTIILAYTVIPVSADSVPVPYITDGNAEFSISNPVNSIQTGDEAYAKITASGLPDDLYAYELWISFDNSYLTYKSAESTEDTAIKVDNYSNGILKICFSSATIDNLNIGVNALATLKFSAKKSGTTKVNLDRAVILSGSMSYTEYQNINKSTTVAIAPKSSNGSSGGGGGSGGSTGGSISIVGGTNSVSGLSPTMVPAYGAAPTDAPEIFNDLSSAEWAAEAILGLYDLGVINGYDDGCYHPDDTITRAEFSKLICAAFSLVTPVTVDETYFTDVDADDWYAVYICAVKNAELINGYEDGSFKPDGSITREEAATILGRTIESLGLDLPADRLNINFNDEDDISDYAVGYIDRLYTMSLINGDNNLFRPGSSLTRAESAQMLWNVILKINQYNNTTENVSILSSYFECETEPILSDAPAAEPTVTPASEPTVAPSEEPAQTPEPTLIPEPTPSADVNPTFVPDKVFDCKTLSELYEYNNIYEYTIPDDGSRDAFYDDFTTYQRSGDGDAYIVFSVPYANLIEVLSYFYAGEELVDFTFDTSVDGISWNCTEYLADYMTSEGKWTRAVYNIKTDCTKYLRINYPTTVNWWTPLVSKVSVSFGEPTADSIKISGSRMLIIPRYDETEYKYEGYVADQIGEKFQGDVVFSIDGEAPTGVTVSEDGTLRISSSAVGNSEIILHAECEEYNLSADYVITLKSAILGDLNSDLIVDAADRELSLKLFSKDKNSADWKLCRDADINGDGLINIVDIGFISKSAAVSAESEADGVE